MDWLEDDDEDGWGLYSVTMYNFFDEDEMEPSWPIWAESLDNAITTYQVLLIFREQMREDA
jgi:hypothetical protein